MSEFELPIGFGRSTTVQWSLRPGVQSEEDAKKAANAPKVMTWLRSINQVSSFQVDGVSIYGVDWFGPNLGFAVAELNVRHVPPAPVFVRGGSACLLMRLCDSEGGVHSIVCKQHRVPVYRQGLVELPACMIDENNNMKGPFVDRLEKEGLVLSPAHLVDLTDLAYRAEHKGVFPIPMHSDEHIRVFLYEDALHEEDLKAFRRSMNGVLKVDEDLSLELVRFDDVWRVAADGKALASLVLYDHLKAAGTLNTTLPKQARQKHQFYICYDTSCQPRHAKKLHEQLKTVSNQHARVFPDRRDMNIDWKDKCDFMEMETIKFIPLVTPELLASFRDLHDNNDPPHLALAEWEMALELRRMDKLARIQPYLIGLDQSIDDIVASMPTVPALTTKRFVKETFRKRNLDASDEMNARSVQDVVRAILANKAVVAKPDLEDEEELIQTKASVQGGGGVVQQAPAVPDVVVDLWRA